jgi:hypothetical protein
MPRHPLIGEGARWLAEGLADPDETMREARLRYVQSHCIPAVRSLIIDRLVELVKEGGSQAGPATASLAKLGPPALSAMTYALSRERTAPAQLRLLEAVGVASRSLTVSQGVDLMTNLMNATHGAADPAVRRAVAGLLAELRRALGKAAAATRRR